MKLGILDQVPLSKGQTVKKTIEQTIELAIEAEKLGYTRYWFAEHHNTNGLLSASPELWITRIASETSKIKVGSGGVLLPQYSPLKVAEMFKSLEAFFPERIDLGIGRSPGGTERTRSALTDGGENNLDEFPRQVDDLIGFLQNDLPKQHPYRMVKATPRAGDAPPIWILGLSPSSGKLAAEKGLGLTFGHFINPDKWEATLTAYREHFKKEPEKELVNACVFVACGETEEEAEEIALSQDMWLLGLEKGDTQVPSLEEIKSKTVSQEDQKKITHNRRRAIVGTPARVKAELEELSRKYGIDEFLIITNTYRHADRLKSYRLIANELNL
ncbi:LLM class flavin-dependent oxidoreductase [Jeotgalibacillus sp. ET6]|uniref:LLM class flavin-dependent oxidoreductase n=1 Tax=Jeotgalibacillus sp. ET6 TaxID=3037260 RepID=UPI0024182DCE|nr:LLM class flavin-dependent oxidoreductase [Jeotgalibacillus sp. ET6]MDG5471863.1 LLM class flavin-dependent oxidoreductase [Jeotgalibacillus sp. ET6]